MNKYVIDTQALIKFLNGVTVINEEIDAILKKTDIPELLDRLIAGTARYLDIPLITNDPVILSSAFLQCVQ